MFHSINEFLQDWKIESTNTAKYLAALTDSSLSVKETEEDRTIGRMAWHIVTTIPELMKHTGIEVASVKENAPVPATAKEILEAYQAAANELATHITQNWKDETLEIADSMYGDTWKRGDTLVILIRHEIHHRGQMSVLMRQAGVAVPGIYGPSREEWVKFGMTPPVV